jgi:hypothetical protein
MELAYYKWPLYCKLDLSNCIMFITGMLTAYQTDKLAGVICYTTDSSCCPDRSLTVSLLFHWTKHVRHMEIINHPALNTVHQASWFSLCIQEVLGRKPGWDMSWFSTVFPRKCLDDTLQMFTTTSLHNWLQSFLRML